MPNEFPVNSLPAVEPLDGPATLPLLEDPASLRVRNRAVSLAGVIGTEPLKVQQDVGTGNNSASNEARTQALQGSVEGNQQIVDDVISTQGTLEEAQAGLRGAEEKRLMYSSASDFFTEEALTLGNPNYSPSAARSAKNLAIAEEIFRERLSGISDETGFFGYAGDFIDRYFLRAIPVGAIEDLTKRSERKGRELLDAATTMDADEYRAFINAYADELSEEGFLTNDNFFALSDGFNEATNAGYDPMSGINQALGALDLLALGKLVGSAGKLGVVGLTGLGKSETTITKAASIAGREIATDVAENTLEASAKIDGELLANMSVEALDTGSATQRALPSRLTQIVENNKLVKGVSELNESGTFGRVATRTQVNDLVVDSVQAYTVRTARNTTEYRVVEDTLGNPILEMKFGKKDGTPFTAKNPNVAQANAQKFANKVEGAEVIPVDPEDLTKGFEVQLQQRLDLTGLSDEIDLHATEYGFMRETLAKVLGSNPTLDDTHLTALAQMGEAGTAAIKQVSKPFLDALNKINLDSKKTVAAVYKELRDGSDSFIRDGYTEGEFRNLFKSLHPNGLDATDKDVQAYQALVSLEDGAWIMKANQILNQYVAKDFWSLDVGGSFRLVGKKFEGNLPKDAKVFDTTSGAVILGEDLDNFKSLWRLDKPTNNGAEYLVDPKGVKILEHSDVMGYNAGGVRMNPKANYFVTLLGDRTKAIMTTFAESEAILAAKQLGNIAKKIDELGGDLRVLSKSDELDDVIRLNNDWDPSIASASDLAKLMDGKGWDLSRGIAYKPRNARVIPEDAEAMEALHGSSWDDFVRADMRRSNDTLMEYGGGETYNVDPVNAILDQFQSASHGYAMRAYTYNSMVSWVKRAQQKGSGVTFDPNIGHTDYQRLYQSITQGDIGSNATARKLATMKGIIDRRLNVQTPLEKSFARFGQGASEYIFEKSGVKLKPTDPSSRLLSIGFGSAFGFFNVSQFVMQGFHVSNIMAIAPKFGSMGTGIAIPMRQILHAPDLASETLGIQRLAKFMGKEETEIKELVDYIKTSGRDMVDGDAIEKGTGVGYGVSGWGGESFLPDKAQKAVFSTTKGLSKFYEAGLTPFKAGERMSRISGINTAFFEFKAKFPNVSAMSDEGRAWITRREQTLTFNMTTGSRPMLQSGVMKVPTQWLSYSFRAAESVVIGRDLSVAERARLAAVLMPFYGLSGFGLASAADYVGEKLGVAPDSNMYIGLKYGFLDYLIAQVTPVETGLATRLAPFDAFVDIYKKINEGDVATAVGGPSGEIATGITEVFMDSVSDLFHGRTVSATEDLIKLLRQPSGIDNVFKAYGVMNNGVYRSKTGATLPTDLKTSDAVILLMGFSPLELTEFYQRRGEAYTDSRKLNTFRKEMDRDMNIAMRLVSEGGTDRDRGMQMIEEMHAKIATSGFSPQQMFSLRKGLQRGNNNELLRLMQGAIREDNYYGAQALQSIIGGK